ncbi:MAG: ABC transporter ATP-binding protein [Acidobacteriota bacterium]
MKEKNKGSVRSLYPLIPYVKKYTLLLLSGFLFILIQNYSLVKIPAFMKGLLDEIVGGNRFHVISGFMVKVIIFTLIEAVSLYLMRKIIISVSRKIEYEIRRRLYNTLLGFDYPFFLKNETGDISSRLTNDLNDVRVLLGPAVMYVPNALSRIVIFFPILIGLSGKLMLIIVPMLAFLVFLIFLILPRLRPKFKKIQETTATINNRVWQTITGMTTIKQNTLEHTETERFRTLNNEYVNVQLDMVRLRSFIRPLFIFLFSIIELVILYVGGGMVISGSMTIGELLQFNIMISALTFPILSLGWIMSMVQLGISAMDRINYIMNNPEPPEEERIPVKEDVEEIEIRNLSFSYPGSEKYSLKDINMKIGKGKMVGITGEVGSGKSTFLDLLSGLLSPEPGMIFINGEDTGKMNKKKLHSFFSVVSQDPFLFSGTVNDNVSIGMKQFDENEVRRAVELASLDSDIRSFPDQYEQRVGERGITLSGGQKQRMSIARAITNRAPVLLLDDPLSSVDSKTEKRILSNLKKIRAGSGVDEFKTVLIISHRISALKECDNIYFFKDGRILESGNHRELIEKKGKYFVISMMQQMGSE